jgi:tetratricopeptide (TPR) repeat protein
VVALVNPDDLAELEEQRDFLARSLGDLDRELAAGDIDADDADTLRRDYTERLARVETAIASGHLELVSAPPPRRRGRTIVIVAVVALLALGAGLGAAFALGSREPGETATGEVRETTNDQLQRAQQLANSGKVLDALKLYDRILRRDPQNLGALLGRGLTLVQVGLATDDPSFAADGQRYIERALEIEPDDAVLLFYFAMSLRAQDKDDEARTAIERALAANPPESLRPQMEQFRESLR